jgi:hypothetical protein
VYITLNILILAKDKDLTKLQYYSKEF